jgi:photosystem II stability/assembly factor-like uncharacterized protein
MWGANANDVYLVGEAGHIWRNKGNGWLASTQPYPLSLNNGIIYSLKDVWGPSATDVYAVGDLGAVIHTIDGGVSWQRESTGLLTGNGGPSIRSVHGQGGTVFIVGDNGLFMHKP